MFSYHQLYKELGSLFYALACESADGSLLISDKEMVEEIILFNWVSLEGSDRFNTDNAYCILFQFNDLDEGLGTPEEAFASFEKYFSDHYGHFDATLRHKIFLSATRITQVIDRIQEPNSHLMKLQAMLEMKAD